MAKRASWGELQTAWTRQAVIDANDLLDAMDDAEEERRRKAEQAQAAAADRRKRRR